VTTTAPDTLGLHERRVLLVGRTGFEQSLRRSDDLALVHARDTLTALGELSLPSDLPTTVLIHMDAEPASPDERAAFLAALRELDPGVRLVRVGPPARGYDDAVWPADGPEDVYEALVGVTPDIATETATETDDAGDPHAATVTDDTATDTDDDAPDATPEHAAPAAPSAAWAPIAAPTSPATAPLHGPTDDRAVLAALLAGKDPTPAAVALLSERLGAPVEFLPADGTTTAPPAADAVPVRHGPLLLGHLRGPGTARVALDDAASWLASWLALDIQQRELRTAALTDPLTGAFNRRYFDRFLAATIARARDLRLPVTLMVFDIDDFKGYNDRFGHGAGDEILIEAAKLMRSVIRPTDRVCRIGGDEFAVVFFEPAGPRSPTSKPPESISTIARRFQKQICQHRFPKLGGQALDTLTISGGLATYPWDGQTASDLLARADQLALKSKQQGKNALTFGPGADRVCHTL
jgi:diguanylate cyclase (GGDEF)-like protein